MRTSLATRRLGTSDLTITTVGFGLVGTRTPAQVDGWIGAAGLELTGADLDEIAEATRRTDAGRGPERP
jgi:hypothetical protein